MAPGQHREVKAEIARRGANRILGAVRNARYRGQRGQVACAGMFPFVSVIKVSTPRDRLRIGFRHGSRRRRAASLNRDPNTPLRLGFRAGCFHEASTVDLGCGIWAKKNPLSYWNSGLNLGCGSRI